MLYCIIVSHNHEQHVKNLLSFADYNPCSDVKILVKDNIGNDELKRVCEKYEVEYFCNYKKMGFGQNNNEMVSKIINKHKINDNLDYVLFLNPDVLIKHEVLVSFYKYIISKNIKASTIDLFKNEDFTKRAEFIRKFPTLTDFVSSIIFNINKTKIDRSKIIEPCEIDWCAGSFLCINLAIFRDIMGFDERYYMYCEDIDLCYRLKLKKIKLVYLPQFKAIHLAMHENRKILSKAFRWHVSNAIYFIIKKSIFKSFDSYSNSVKTIFRG